MRKQRVLLTEELLEHLSWLARVELSEEEKKMFVKDLNKILEFFDKLDEVNVENVEPTSHVAFLANITRKDEPRNPMSRKEALANAPQKENGYFKAPRIL